MDIIDRILGHDAWTTRQLLLACRDLSPDDLARRFDIGPGSLNDTFAHIVGTMQRWADRIAERAVSESLEGRTFTIDELLDRLDGAAASLRDVARDIADSGRLDEPMEVTYEGRRYTFTRGTAIVHVTSHGMHHRAQVLNMLRHLGVSHELDGDAIEWEIGVCPVERVDPI